LRPFCCKHGFNFATALFQLLCNICVSSFAHRYLLLVVFLLLSVCWNARSNFLSSPPSPPLLHRDNPLFFESSEWGSRCNFPVIRFREVMRLKFQAQLPLTTTSFNPIDNRIISEGLQLMSSQSNRVAWTHLTSATRSTVQHQLPEPFPSYRSRHGKISMELLLVQKVKWPQIASEIIASETAAWFQGNLPNFRMQPLQCLCSI